MKAIRILVVGWTDALASMDGLDDLRTTFVPLAIVAILDAFFAGTIMGLAIKHHGLLMAFANKQGIFPHILWAGGTFVGALILVIIAEMLLGNHAYRRRTGRL